MPDQAERDSPAIGMAAWNRDGVLVPGSTAVRLPVVTLPLPQRIRLWPGLRHRKIIATHLASRNYSTGVGLHTVMVTLEPLPTDAPPAGFWVTTLPLSVLLQLLVVAGVRGQPRVLQCGRRLVLGL